MIRLAVCSLVLTAVMQGQKYSDSLPVHHPAIRYEEQAPEDPVAHLQRQLEQRSATLEYVEGGQGYLPSVLRLLGISVDSQALVFSKTSFQAQKVSPHNPRAIYFNDTVAVGFLRGQGLELASLDPRQGTIFYTLAPGKSDLPRFTREETCLRCHQGPATSGVPGVFIGSVYPGSTGLPDRTGAIVTDHRTPFKDRWGGWYVNAKSGQQLDRSNSFAPDPDEPELLDTLGHQNLLRLDRFFNASGYLSPVSDIVALMTFEHQTQMTNLFTRLGWQARLNASPAKLDSELESAVDYMLFTGEAGLAEPIEGVSSFTRTFPQHGPRDRQGRSLRDFDLQTRLFKYPLSYLIYSPQFDALPQAIQQKIYARVFDKLSRECKQSVIEIVCDTKGGVPASWCGGI